MSDALEELQATQLESERQAGIDQTLSAPSLQPKVADERTGTTSKCRLEWTAAPPLTKSSQSLRLSGRTTR
jgi:hypothetical protein